MTLVLNYAARSDMGLVRGNNEDSVYAGPRLLALADGMGGHAAGEVASQLLISAIAPLDNDQPSNNLLEDLRRSVELGNDLIAEEIDNDPELLGMGSTLVAMLFDGPKMGMVNVGDSRAYLLRDGQLHQITRDDSFVQDLVDEGRITPEEASVHPKRSLITNALMGGDFEPHLTIREVVAGDRYLICSDGLSDPVSFETIKSTMSQGTPQQCADRLVDLALRSGGPDNITLIVADVNDDDYGPTTPMLGGAAAKGLELDAEDDDRADSAAARAAALVAENIQRANPQAVGSEGSGGGSADTDEDADGETAANAASKERKKRLSSWSKRLVVIIIAIVVLVAVGAISAVTYAAKNTYYVDINDEHEVLIYHGINNSALGPFAGKPDSVLCEDAIYDVNSEPEECQRLLITDFTPALRSELVSDKVFHTQKEARAYLTRAVGSGLLPLCDPKPIIIWGADGTPIGTKDHPDPCRRPRHKMTAPTEQPAQPGQPGQPAQPDQPMSPQPEVGSQ
ncbi:MAG: protein phosphatase 2C domain-containing protein [Lawsonella sp.]